MYAKSALILASASPRRAELLALTGLPFTRHPSNYDEAHIAGESPSDYVQRTAFAKGALIPRNDHDFVLSADTIVVFEDQIIGKPTDTNDARKMLTKMRARTHSVFTALSLWHQQKAINALCESQVHMRDYSDAELEAYLQVGNFHDKAGSYAIQDTVFHPAQNWQGCYANVMGLPLCLLSGLLAQAGFPPNAEIPAICQATLHINCPLYAQFSQSSVQNSDSQ